VAFDFAAHSLGVSRGITVHTFICSLLAFLLAGYADLRSRDRDATSCYSIIDYYGHIVHSLERRHADTDGCFILF